MTDPDLLTDERLSTLSQRELSARDAEIMIMLLRHIAAMKRREERAAKDIVKDYNDSLDRYVGTQLEPIIRRHLGLEPETKAV